jgi:hypothetical protein
LLRDEIAALRRHPSRACAPEAVGGAVSGRGGTHVGYSGLEETGGDTRSRLGRGTGMGDGGGGRGVGGGGGEGDGGMGEVRVGIVATVGNVKRLELEAWCKYHFAIGLLFLLRILPFALSPLFSLPPPPSTLPTSTSTPSTPTPSTAPPSTSVPVSLSQDSTSSSSSQTRDPNLINPKPYGVPLPGFHVIILFLDDPSDQTARKVLSLSLTHTHTHIHSPET